MVRPIVSRVLRFCVVVLFSGAMLTGKAFAGADNTSISLTGVAATTGISSCDAANTTTSCLGQQVTFTAVVSDGPPNANGAPTGRVDFFDGSVLIGSGILATATTTSTATFATALLTITGAAHSITAQYVSSDTGLFKNSGPGTASWTVQTRPTTTTVTPPGLGITVGATGNITVSVADAGPINSGATSGTFQAPGTPINLNTARFGFGGALLPSGAVLIAGGTGTTVLSSAELVKNSATLTGSLNTPRTYLTATALQDGTVLIVGGSADTCNAAATNGVLDSVELYDPNTGTFSNVTTATLGTARCGHSATLLPNGTVLIAGGYNGSGAALKTTEVYDPVAQTISPGPIDIGQARAGHVAALLQNGKVLMAGGDLGGDAELYDPTGSTAPTTGNMTLARSWSAGYTMLDGDVVLAGGIDPNTTKATTSAELYDASSQTFVAISSALNTARAAFGAVPLTDGSIGFAGGLDATPTPLGTVESYTPAYDPKTKASLTSADSSDNVGASSTTSASCPASFVLSSTGTSTCTITLKPGHVNGGTHVLTGSYAANGAHATSFDSAHSLTVNTTPLTLAAKNQSIAYGNTHTFSTLSCSNAAADCTASGLINGDTVTVTYSATAASTAGTAVGTYTGDIVISSPVISNAVDYSVQPFGKGNTTITKRPVTATADAKSKVYGDTDPALTYQITSGSLFTGDSFSGALTRAAGEHVAGSPYAIQQNTLALSANYTLTYIGANFTITTRPVTVTADAKTKVYGDADPALTYQLTSGNLVTGDSITGALTRVVGEHVAAGPYQIKQGTVTAGTDYNITYVAANLTVTKRPITVTADPQTKIYGNADPTLTYQLTTGTLATGDAFSGALSRAVGEHVASSPYQIQQGSVIAGVATDYNLTFVPANLTVTTRPISVTADPQTKVYGNPDPTLTVQVTSGSLATGDSFSGALSRVAGEHVAGSPYAISQGTLVLGVATDYNLTFTGSNLTITVRPITVTAVAKTKLYGDVDPALTFSVTSGSLATGDSFTGALTRVAGEHVAGSPYAIQQGTLVAGTPTDYALTYAPANLTITLRPVTIAADAKAKTYGDADPALTFSITSGSLASGDAFVGSLSRTTGELVAGSPYAIQQGSVALTADYNLAYVPNSLMVNLRPLSIAAVSGSKIYGTAPSFAGTNGAGLGQFSVSNLVNGDSVTSVALASTGQAANAAVVTGGYAIVASNPQGSGLANYSPVFTPGTLTVLQATPAMRAEQVATKIDPATGGFVITLKAFLYNSNAPGATQGTGVGTPTQTVDIFDGTTKLNTSPITLVADTTSGPCSSTNQNCGSEVSFVTAPIKVAAGTTHNINIAYSGDTNFASRSAQVGALAGAASNTFISSNFPPSTSTSTSFAIASPEPLLSGQSYVLKCKVFAANTGVEQTAAICNPSSGTSAITLPGNITIAVQTTTVTTTGELRMRGIYDLSFSMPAMVLVGVGLPLAAFKRRVKGRQPLVWLGITVALILCLVAVGCGGNGFANPGKIPVVTAASAQAGQYTVIITATNSSNNNSFDVATVPFTISQ